MSNELQKNLALNEEEKEQLKQLVLARLSVMPDGIRLSIGGSNDLTKGELIEYVKSEDEIGKQFMSMELEFLQDLASGAIYGNE